MRTDDENTYNKIIGDKILAARLSAGLSQDAIGAMIGCTFQQVQKYEKGVNRISLFSLAKISRITGKAIAYFFDEVAPPKELTANKIKTSLNVVVRFNRLSHKAQQAVLDIIKIIDRDDDE